MSTINTNLLEAWRTDTKDAKSCFDLAVEYAKNLQLATAASLYLRAVESDVNVIDDDLKYEAFLQLFSIYRKMGDRKDMELNWLMHAVVEYPNRPEAYFQLSVISELNGDYMMSYYWSSIGLEVYNPREQRRAIVPPEADLFEYYGYGLHLQKAVAAWWIGRRSEFLSILQTLKINPDLCPYIRNRVLENLQQLGGPV